MRKTLLLFLSVLWCTAIFGQTQPVRIVSPTVEMQDGSQPLATSQPRFSWKYADNDSVQNVRQTSYRLIVASTKENARRNIGDLWDTKTVSSDQMLYIPYKGKPLESRDNAYWKVVTYVTYTVENRNQKKNNTGTSTIIEVLESEVKSFEISLLHSEDWSALWIGHEFNDDSLLRRTRIAARYLRKEFHLRDDIREARLYVCGLGQYSAFLNGTEVAAEEIFKPALSDYRKRVYFNAFDVTHQLHKGDNAIGVILAAGRYFAMRYNRGENEWGGETHVMHYGRPRMILQLEITYQDGTTERIVSNDSWKITNQGPIRTLNEFDGETYDARLELGDWTSAGYDDSQWIPVFGVHPPEGSLMPQSNPNLKVQDTVRPVALFRKGDQWMLDMGQNMVGYLGMHIRGQYDGDTITLRFGESLNPDSTLYTENLRGAGFTDRYVASHRGTAQYWHPTFTYHGFRYVEITGLRGKPSLSDFEGLVLYDEMAVTGHFETSNEILNAVYHNAYWGIRGNYRSMPTDCPQRDERMGWTGDRTTGNYGESYIFDNHRLYSKWLIDGEDSQWYSGSLSDVWPNYWRRYTDNMTWPGALITVADMLYTRYGDIEPIRLHYEAMKRWMLYMKRSYLVDGILTRDCYGDWCMPPESLNLVHAKDPSRMTQAPVISTPFYCYLAGKMAYFAGLLGKTTDVAMFQADIAYITKAYNDKYLDQKTGRYDNNTVTANILPLAFGMVPKDMEDKVFANIIDKTMNEFGGHVSTGVVGIQQLMRTLTDHGRGDLAFKIASSDTYPSWGYMVRNGATTIWELWNGNTAAPYMNSGNHVMLLGDLILWEYEYLAGIRALEPGYRKIQLKPYPVDGLNRVTCTYQSVSGDITSSWRHNRGRLEWNIHIPANTEAEVWLPTSKGYEVKTFGSGNYRLTSKLP
ncbi:MAG: family 78 glycoside hydrolase catalytic domain [Bacteroidales bacterium]|nr:family 78 glycoside hydrolase catalytic domain [Bacteroidales bacterium]